MDEQKSANEINQRLDELIENLGNDVYSDYYIKYALAPYLIALVRDLLNIVITQNEILKEVNDEVRGMEEDEAL